MPNIFDPILKGKILFLGVGNVLRGDDAFGPEFIKAIDGKASAICIDAGTSPENYFGKIIKEAPDTVVIFDAASMELAPGEYRLLRKDDIVKSGFTTHDLSPAMLIEYLEKEIKTDIYMLAVQPENISFGAEMSASVKNTLNKITVLVKEKLHA